MAKAMNNQSIPPGEGVLHHDEGVDLIPANIERAGLEVSQMCIKDRYKEAKEELLKLKTAKQNVASFFREEEPAQQER